MIISGEGRNLKRPAHDDGELERFSGRVTGPISTKKNEIQKGPRDGVFTQKQRNSLRILLLNEREREAEVKATKLTRTLDQLVTELRNEKLREQSRNVLGLW
jgi:hypothetical protein